MSEERDLLRETVAALVEKHASPAAVREAIESEHGYDESLWKLLCEQVGAAALVVPEELGGAGGELADAAVVLEELGKALVPTPLLGTTLAELALLAADEPDTDAIERLAEGASIGTVVFDTDERSREENSGRNYVVNGAIADVVVATDGKTLTRWTTFTATPRRHHGPDPPVGPDRARWHNGHRRRSRPGRHRGDPGCRRADRRRREVPRPDRRIHQGPGSVRPPDRQLPGAQAPDGRPVRRGAVGAGGCRTTAIAEPSATSAALARVAASEAFSKVAAEAVQMHGGIAITWEHDIQLYFKRAHAQRAAARTAAGASAPARIRGVLALSGIQLSAAHDVAHKRYTGPIGQMDIRGCIKAHKVCSLTRGEDSDVITAKRGGTAGGRRPQGLRRSEVHVPDRHGQAERHVGGERTARVAIGCERDGHAGGDHPTGIGPSRPRREFGPGQKRRNRGA